MSEQLGLFTAARTTDPETSQVNRDAFVKKASQRDLILLTYEIEWRNYEATFGVWSRTDGGLTDEECGMRTPWKHDSGSTTRRCTQSASVIGSVVPNYANSDSSNRSDTRERVTPDSNSRSARLRRRDVNTLGVFLRKDWRNRAKCSSLPTSIFFPENAQSDRVWDRAREVCASCDVRVECLAFALSYEEPEDRWGMYAGMTPNERNLIRNERMKFRRE
jgi:WhiB family redox-sensing transcriptional regulator